jgi:cell division protein FtsB
VTRRRGFWPGQSGHSVPPGFLGDDEGEQAEPAVRWRAIDHPLHPDDVAHGGSGAPGDFDRSDDRHASDAYDDHYGYDDHDGVHRFDDLGGRGGIDVTEPLDEVLRNDAGAVLRAVLLDRDDFRVEPREPRGRWRMSLARRLEAAWPGQTEEGAPPGFPASGELVLHRPPVGSTLVRLPVRGAPAENGDQADAAEGDLDLDPVAGSAGNAGDAALGALGALRGRFGGRRPADVGAEDDRPARRGGSVPGLPSPRSLQRVATAVYAALADPIVNADPEAREHRAAQVRRFGLLAGSAALAVVLIYAIFPVRTYLEQRAATQRARERMDKLSEANAELEDRKEQLRDDETVEEIARRDYQLVFPGEESYGLLPPPVPPTTTTTTPDG